MRPFMQLSYHHDALDIIRLGEGDERIAPAVRAVLHGAKARTYARLGQPDACRRQIEAAETTFELASPDEPGWVGRLANPAKLHAITGHALADLTEHTAADHDREEAIQRLTKAIDQFHPDTHTRALALCAARVATLRTASNDPDEAEDPTAWIREKLPPGQHIRSTRLGEPDTEAPTNRPHRFGPAIHPSESS